MGFDSETNNMVIDDDHGSNAIDGEQVDASLLPESDAAVTTANNDKGEDDKKEATTTTNKIRDEMLGGEEAVAMVAKLEAPGAAVTAGEKKTETNDERKARLIQVLKLRQELESYNNRLDSLKAIVGEKMELSSYIKSELRPHQKDSVAFMLMV